MSRRLILVVLSIALSAFACEDRDDGTTTTGRDTSTGGDATNTDTGTNTDATSTTDATNTTDSGGGDTTGTPEDNNVACSDGLDNDNNGFIDCADFSCSRSPNVTICVAEASNSLCSDGEDNDHNSFTDCDDNACKDLAVCREATNKACSDGEDNDGDNLTDCADEDCQKEGMVVCVLTDGNWAPADPLPTDFVAAANAACTDGEDGDDNGFTDCGDFGCSLNIDATECHDLTRESSNTTCSDGIDNDKDGLIDCEERRCYEGEGIVVCASQGVAVDPIPSDSEITTAANERCSDGINQDGNTGGSGDIIDCQDFSCSQDPLVTVCASAEGNDETCSDGVDNDENGFTDCGDFSCSQNPNVTVCETSAAKCGDGIDNDGNGFKDCDDRSCENTVECE